MSAQRSPTRAPSSPWTRAAYGTTARLSVFGTTTRDVRTFTRAPILISETAAGPSPDEADQIIGLFRGVRADHLRGAVWFDMTQHAGQYHQDWRLEDSPAARATFRKQRKDGPYSPARGRTRCRRACCSYAATPIAILYGPRMCWSSGEMSR